MSGRLLSGTRVCFVQERLCRRRELYRLRMVRESKRRQDQSDNTTICLVWQLKLQLRSVMHNRYSNSCTGKTTLTIACWHASGSPHDIASICLVLLLPVCLYVWLMMCSPVTVVIKL